MSEGPSEESASARLLHALALRLLAPDASVRKGTQLFVNQLPDGVPAHITLPANSRLLGSLMEERRQRATIVFDTPLTAAEVETFYRDHLTVEGWEPRPSFPVQERGFVSTTSNSHSSRVQSLRHDDSRIELWRSDVGPVLRLEAEPGLDGQTQILLELEAMPAYLPGELRWQWHWCELVPVLLPPAHSSLQQRRWLYGTCITATLMTVLDLDNVVAHYHDQLRRVGWTKLSEEHVGTVAWSIWRVQDVDGTSLQGRFHALRKPWDGSAYELGVRVLMDGTPWSALV